MVCRATGLDTVVRGDQAKHFAQVSGLSSAATRFLLYPTEAKGLSAEQIDAMKAKLALHPSAAIEQLSWDPWLKSAFPEGSFPVKKKKEKAPKELNTPKQAKASKGSAPASSARGRRGRGEDDDELPAAARFPVACEKPFLVSVSDEQTVLDIGRVATAGHRFVAFLPAGFSHEVFQTKDGRTFIVMEVEED